MRIGIDARLAGSRHGGIGRYVEELIKHLLGLKTPHEWVVFLHDLDQLPWLKHGMKVKIIVCPISHYSFAEQLHMPAVFEREHLDLLHVPHFNVPIRYKRSYVVTIHDLLWHERRDRRATTLTPLIHLLKYEVYKYVANTAVLGAKRVIVPTKHVAKVVEVVTHRSDSIVIPEGVTADYQPKGKTFGYTFPYLMYLGSLYPHKNVPFILLALEKYTDLHFVVVSARSVFRDTFMKEVTSRGFADRVHVHEFLQDTEVAKLLRGSVALVTPSLSEGFGLPGLEAMACGTPVIASDIPVFREVYGDAAIYVNPYHPKELIRAVGNLRAKPEMRKKLVAKGFSVSHAYSWQKMAKRTLQVYEHATA